MDKAQYAVITYSYVKKFNVPFGKKYSSEYPFRRITHKKYFIFIGYTKDGLYGLLETPDHSKKLKKLSNKFTLIDMAETPLGINPTEKPETQMNIEYWKKYPKNRIGDFFKKHKSEISFICMGIIFLIEIFYIITKVIIQNIMEHL